MCVICDPIDYNEVKLKEHTNCSRPVALMIWDFHSVTSIHSLLHYTYEYQAYAYVALLRLGDSGSMHVSMGSVMASLQQSPPSQSYSFQLHPASHLPSFIIFSSHKEMLFCMRYWVRFWMQSPPSNPEQCWSKNLLLKTCFQVTSNFPSWKANKLRFYSAIHIVTLSISNYNERT